MPSLLSEMAPSQKESKSSSFFRPGMRDLILSIIADEPTGNLDPARSLEIMRLLERINQLGTTMVVVTHEKDLVNQFRKRVITLDQGLIMSDVDGVGYNAR